MFSLIVAIDRHNAIGKNNELLCYLPNDLKHFKAITMGKTIVMGRKTFESLPNGALPMRRNIVLTTQTDWCASGVENAESIQQVQTLVENEAEVCIIGGGQVYELFMPYADKLYITQIHHEFDGVDTFFPEIKPEEWQCVSEEYHETDERHKYAFSFVEFTRKKL